MTGLELIAAERRRQIEQEGWTAEHDEQHEVDHLAAAAAAYVLAQRPGTEMPKGWPWGREWWKPKDRLRNLVRAGALYLAASDLADRRGMPDRSASLCELADQCAAKIDELLLVGKLAPCPNCGGGLRLEWRLVDTGPAIVAGVMEKIGAEDVPHLLCDECGFIERGKRLNRGGDSVEL
ncbi:MAG: hypothetical protein AB1768_19940 [Pseudomonadota bacterium]